MADELTEHDVAVVVFMRAPGVDAGDAADRVEAFLRQNVAKAPEDAHSGLPMHLLAVRELGNAAGAGFIRLAATGAPARWRGLAPIDNEED